MSYEFPTQETRFCPKGEQCPLGISVKGYDATKGDLALFTVALNADATEFSGTRYYSGRVKSGRSSISCLAIYDVKGKKQ